LLDVCSMFTMLCACFIFARCLLDVCWTFARSCKRGFALHGLHKANELTVQFISIQFTSFARNSSRISHLSNLLQGEITSCSASDFAYCDIFLCTVVYHLSVVCRIHAPCLNRSTHLHADWQLNL